ncbi:GntR family transcriptional regulator [Agromyces silvae]|uniref:GntR family transcriptional regulator n=1 Tax=Agromyces silvae TaxID=3388266 RepID=UPI00280BC5E2|nr:GntR family transcriptional regulator [Agromyces protaetiae]
MKHHPYVPNPGHVLTRRHTTVDQVHAMMLAAIAGGDLLPGQELRDQAWAAELKVSRTPIREAIKRLEAHGIVDIAAARYTRLASFTPDEARREAHDWAAIHLALVSDLCESAERPLILALEKARSRFHGSTGIKAHAANFTFFEHLRATSTSFSVHLGAVAVAYRLRLALPNLPDLHDADDQLHTDILAALTEHKADTLAPSFTRWLHAANHEPAAA